MKTTHLEAKRIADALPGIDPETSLLVRTIAYGESHYGDDRPGLHPWGNVVATPDWTGETFELQHSQWDEEKGKAATAAVRFRAYPSNREAAEDLWGVLQSSHSGAVEAARRGDWWDVARELRASRYYLGTKSEAAAIREYGALMARSMTAITSSTGERNRLATRSGRAAAWAASALFGSLVFGAFQFFSRRGKP